MEMAHSGGFDKLTDRLQNALSCDDGGDDTTGKNNYDDKNADKPDFRELDLGGSPISPLRGNARAGQLGGTHASGAAPTTSATTNTTVFTSTTTTTSSSSSSSGSISGRHSGPITGATHSNHARRSDSNSHSGELSGSVESSPTGQRGGSGSGAGSGSGSRGSGSLRPAHARSDSSGSHPHIYSGSIGGSSTVNSPTANVLPTGNICPSGKILKTGMMSNRTTKTDVLGSGGVNYGHGSIMRGSATARSGLDGGSPGGAASRAGLTLGGETARRATTGRNVNEAEELKKAGNDNYKKGNFLEAISLYGRAIAISPGNATLHFNRAAALMGLRRLVEAVKECEEAIKLDPRYVKAHHRLGALFLSLGQVEKARSHLYFPGHHADPVELQKLQAVEQHLSKCTDARRVADWIGTLREIDAAIASGADSSPQLFACRAEALLKLHQQDDAIRSFSNMPKFGSATASYSQSTFFGMLSEAYISFVRAQIELAQGRFEDAVNAAEKAGQIDARNVEVSVLVKNVRLVARARARGNDLFRSERFTEASSAYGDGLRLDPSNSVLYCNRAACWYKLGKLEQCLDDCSQALRLQPNYTKALLRKAATNSKLERWAEAVRDYEVLRKELPYDNEIAEQLFHAQVALKKSRGEEVSNMKFGGEVEIISGLEQFRAAISSPCASVVHFKTATNLQCKQISPFLDTLCTRYPSINFLMVDVEENPAIANAEDVRIVPTFKIYKKGSRVKEMVCPSPEVLESSVRHYSI